MQMRFLIEGSLDIAICLGFQFYYSDQNSGLSFGDAFLGVNTVMTVFFSLCLSIFLPFVFVFYYRMRRSWQEPNFNEKYGEIFEGLRKDRTTSMLFPLNLFVRRFVFSAVAILAIEYVFA